MKEKTTINACAGKTLSVVYLHIHINITININTANVSNLLPLKSFRGLAINVGLIGIFSHLSAKPHLKYDGMLLHVRRFAIEEEEYVEFSKLTQDHIIGTKGEIATVSLSPTGGVNFVLPRC